METDEAFLKRLKRKGWKPGTALSQVHLEQLTNKEKHMPHTSLPLATKTAAEALLKRMKGKGWKVRIWENIGWHYCVENGPLSVHASGDGMFDCLLGVKGTGEGLWNGPGDPRHSDPNEVVRLQIEHAKAKFKALVAHYQGFIDAAERAVGK